LRSEQIIPRTTGFVAAAALWASLYEVREQRPYRWTPRCHRHLADILRDAGSVDAFRRIALEIFADNWPGYDGHELKYLWRDFSKFRARAARAPADEWAGRNPTATELAMIRESPKSPRFQDN
jgi:hypothetical protein